MIIICPNCTTNYDIDPKGVGAKGREVKCASCATFWHVEPEQQILAVANGEPIHVAEVPTTGNDTSDVDETKLDDAFAELEDQDTTSSLVEVAEPEEPSFVEPTPEEPEAEEPEPEDDLDLLGGALSHEDLLSELEGLPSQRELKARAAKLAREKAEQEERERAEREAAEKAAGGTGAGENVIDVPDEEYEAKQAEITAEEKKQQEIEEANTRRNARMKRIAKRNRALANAMPAARVRRLWGFGSVFSLVATVMLVFLCREPIVRLLPDLAGLYRLVGIEVNVLGLEFDQIKSERRHDNGKVLLIVTGIVRNVTNKPIELPKILVSLETSGSEEVYAWSIDPSVAYLDTGEAVEFDTMLSDPPAIADNVKLSFLAR